MIAIRHSQTGEVQLVEDRAAYGLEWLDIDPPPASEGYQWDAANEVWVERGPRLWRPVDFLSKLFTPAEVIALDRVSTATAPGQLLAYAIAIARTAERINLDDPTTAAVLSLAVQMGIVTEARASRIVAGLPPA